MRKILPLVLSCIISVNVSAKETLYWAQYDIPPFYIKDGSYSDKGIVDITDEMIRAELPQYNHVKIWANIARIRHMMEQGKKIICGNLLKTPEREKYQIFSSIHRVLPTALHVIIPLNEKNNYNKYINNDKSIDLLRLINSKDKIGYFIASRSYGSKYDTAIQDRKNKRINYALNAPMGNVFDMLIKDKNGFTIAYPEELIYYTESKFGYGSSIVSDLNKKSYLGRFKIIRISGQPEQVTTYVTAPKTEWGRKVISEINHVLIKLSSNHDYINDNYQWRNLINREED